MKRPVKILAAIGLYCGIFAGILAFAAAPTPAQANAGEPVYYVQDAGTAAVNGAYVETGTTVYGEPTFENVSGEYLYVYQNPDTDIYYYAFSQTNGGSNLDYVSTYGSYTPGVCAGIGPTAPAYTEVNGIAPAPVFGLSGL